MTKKTGDTSPTIFNTAIDGAGAGAGAGAVGDAVGDAVRKLFDVAMLFSVRSSTLSSLVRLHKTS
jgi:hypothetical protein